MKTISIHKKNLGFVIIFSVISAGLFQKCKPFDDGESVIGKQNEKNN
jgi:hypothetical protein